MYKLPKAFLNTISNENTRKAYTTDLDRIATDLQGRDLLELDCTDLETYFIHCRNNNASSALLRRRLAALRYFYKWGIVSSRISADPSDKIRIAAGEYSPNNNTPRQKPLTQRQLDHLLDSCTQGGSDSLRDYALIFFLSHVPLRRSTTSKMNYEDIRFGDGYSFLEVPISRGGLPIRYTLSPEVALCLEEHCEANDIDTGPIWRSSSRRNFGGRLTPTSIYRIIRRRAEDAGMPGIGANDLRKTACILAATGGASIQQVQTHARHKQIETTMAYVHQRDRLRDSAADFIQLDSPDEE